MSRLKKEMFHHLNDMPNKHESFILNWKLGVAQFEEIKNGYASMGMDDQWDIYFDRGELFLHRSWTGNCIFVATIEVNDEGGATVTKVLVNRDEKQYKFTSIEQDEILFKQVIGFTFLNSDSKAELLNIRDEKFAQIITVIPKEYLVEEFSLYQDSVDNFLSVLKSILDYGYIDKKSISGIDEAINKLSALKPNYVNVINVSSSDKTLFVISDEQLGEVYGVVEF